MGTVETERLFLETLMFLSFCARGNTRYRTAQVGWFPMNVWTPDFVAFWMCLAKFAQENRYHFLGPTRPESFHWCCQWPANRNQTERPLAISLQVALIFTFVHLCSLMSHIYIYIYIYMYMSLSPTRHQCFPFEPWLQTRPLACLWHGSRRERPCHPPAPLSQISGPENPLTPGCQNQMRRSKTFEKSPKVATATAFRGRFNWPHNYLADSTCQLDPFHAPNGSKWSQMHLDGRYVSICVYNLSKINHSRE